MVNQEKVGAVIVAAGESSRMAGIDKMFALVHGISVISRTFRNMAACSEVEAVVVVVNSKNIQEVIQMAEAESWEKLRGICPGGKRRQDSVAAGLELLGDCKWVVIHDGARPLMNPDLITEGLKVAKTNGNAIAAVQSKDTIKLVGCDGRVKTTPERGFFWLAQTPQIFRKDILDEAHKNIWEDVTDDASMVEALGLPVQIFKGERRNLKITTPEDLLQVEAILMTDGCP